MNDEELLESLDKLRNMMNSVATGGPRINDVNDKFQRTYASVASTLSRKGITNPLPYGNLWDWYGRWSSGDMPNYKSRRTFVAELFNPLINLIQTGRTEEFEPTGWARVDRAVGELRDRFASATNEEQFQAVGVICRETLISLAQAVYDPEKHPPLDGVTPSATDGKRMLESYIAVELGGGANQETRQHAKSALKLAVTLQHKRTASFRDTAMCVEATTSVVNLIAIISGHRDPQ